MDTDIPRLKQAMRLMISHWERRAILEQETLGRVTEHTKTLLEGSKIELKELNES